MTRKYSRYRLCVPRTRGREGRTRMIDFVLAFLISLAFVVWGIMR